MQRKADRSGWDDFHSPIPHDVPESRMPRPFRPSMRATATNGRGWYHARWITLIVVLIAANGYAVSAYLAAKAGQTSSIAEWFAAKHTVDALHKHEKAGLSEVASGGTERTGPARALPNTNDYRADQARGQAMPLATRRIEPDPATLAKQKQMGDASKAGTLKCIAGVPYQVTKHDGITSYTNFPGATCES